MALVHQHLLIHARVARPIVDIERGLIWISDLVAKLGMRLLSDPTGGYCDEEGNRGLTLLAPITTSHIALHIWDEPAPALIELDVYSCRLVDPAVVFAHIAIMQPTSTGFRFLDRANDFCNLEPTGD